MRTGIVILVMVGVVLAGVGLLIFDFSLLTEQPPHIFPFKAAVKQK
jgi:hypothetical protein